MSTAVPLPLTELHPSRLIRRQHVNPKALQELTESVKAHGVIQPILVRPRKEGGFEIVAGHRRWTAAKAAKLPDAPCITRELTDAQALELAIVENVQREDVHPLDEAEGYRTLMKEAGYDVEKIAAKVGKDGKSVSYVYQRLKLLDLVPKAKEAFLEDRITAGHAVQIARLQPADQEEALKACWGREWDRGSDVERKALVSVRALGWWIAENVHLDLTAAPWKKDDATLVPKAGPCTTCPKRTGMAPMLFPDIQKKDTCTDRVCFGQKMAAHLERKRQELAAAKTPFREVSEDYSRTPRTPKGALTRGSYTVVKPKACAKAQAALVVDGTRRGQVQTVCADPACKVHGHGGPERFGPSPKERERRKKVAQRDRVEFAFRARLLDTVLQKVPAPLGRSELEVVAVHCMQRLWHEHSKRVCARHGWLPKKTHWGGKAYDDAAIERIRKMPAPEVGRFLVEVGLLGTTDLSDVGSGPKDLLALAKRYRIDVNAVRRAAAPAPKKKPRQGKKK